MPISYDTGAMTGYDLGRRKNLLDLAKFLAGREDMEQANMRQKAYDRTSDRDELRRIKRERGFAEQDRSKLKAEEQARKGQSLRTLQKNWTDRIRAAETGGLYGSPLPLAMDPSGGVTRLDEIEQGKQAIDFLSIAAGGGGGGGAIGVDDIYGKETPEQEAARRAFAGVKAGYLSPQEKEAEQARLGRESQERLASVERDRDARGEIMQIDKMLGGNLQMQIDDPEQHKYYIDRRNELAGQVSQAPPQQQPEPSGGELKVREEGGRTILSNQKFQEETGQSKSKIDSIVSKAETAPEGRRVLKENDRKNMVQVIADLSGMTPAQISRMDDRDLGMAYRELISRKGYGEVRRYQRRSALDRGPARTLGSRFREAVQR
jgi:hypothetical protein